MYRNALQKDQRYGPAYYRLALSELKLGRVSGAVGSLRRAIELLPHDQPERWDAAVKLSELYLALARNNKQYMDEVDGYIKGLFERDPESFDAHRLSGDMLLAQAEASYRTGNREQAKEQVRSAIQAFQKADGIKAGDRDVMLALARAYNADQRPAEAEKLYRQVIDKDKSLMAAYTELYGLYLLQNKAVEAEAVLKSAAAANPKQYHYLTLLAGHYYGQKRRDDVVRVLDRIKSHAKENEQAYLTVGDFYLRMGEAEEAIRQYKEGMAARPQQKTVYEKRVIEALMRQGKKAEAAEVASAILKDNPKDSDARGLQASLLLEKGDVLKAIGELQAVVSTAPDNFVARYNLGRAHAARGEWEQARQQFTASIKQRPNYFPARLALAQVQLSRGEYDAAIRSATEIRRFDPQNVSAQMIQSAALMGLRRFQESRQILRAMQQANPNAPAIYLQLGALGLAERQYQDAEENFRKAFALEPANPRGLLGVVETYLVQKKQDEAIHILQAEIRKSPKRADLRAALGNTAVRAGKFDLAVSEFQAALAGLDKGSTGSADLHLRLGETHRRKGDLNKSIAELQKARAIVPDHPAVLSTLGLVYDAAGRKQEARQAYEHCLKIAPGNGVVLNNLAFLLAEQGGDLDQALTMAQRAKQLLPHVLEVSDTLGWIYLKKNLSDSAIDIFRELVSKDPKMPTYRYHLGMALSQKGDTPTAMKELQQALRSNPSKEEELKIKELLDKLG
jgi:tetratricopeptide (TPR) repeat protein